MSLPTVMMIWCMLLLSHGFVPAQAHDRSQPESVIDLDSDLVVVDVTVTDAQGQAVSGLKKENFNVYEDHLLQTVAFFTTVDQAVSIGLVLDRSRSMIGMIQEVYTAALATLEAGIAKDEAFIITFNNKVKRISKFTTNVARLKRSIKNLEADGPTALYDGIRRGLDTIQNGRHRKRALVVVTDGMDNSSRTMYPDLLELAQERGVPVYIVGLSLGAAQLGQLSRITGGRNYYSFNMTDIRDACRRISVQLHQQYSLAYYPTKPLREGEWRNIKVEVVQSEDHRPVRVRYKKGYYVRVRQ